jgi:hypothetical protein
MKRSVRRKMVFTLGEKMENIMHHLFLPVIILEWFAFLSFYYKKILS